MKKRLFALLLALVMVCGLMPAAVAVSDDDATKAAQALYDLGLFQGTGANADGTPNFDLGRTPTRAEAVTMLVRLLGKEEEAKAGAWTTPFTDVDEWAEPYVGYAYTNGLTTGTSATTFGGKETIDASQYLTFVLRALGYESGKDFQWNAAWEKSDAIGLTKGSYNANAKSITRGDVAVISEKAIRTAQKGTSELLGASLDNPNFEYRPVTIENLQGTWMLEGTENGLGQEVIIDGNVATFMMRNSIETVYQSGPFVIVDGNEVRWTSSDYYLYAPTSIMGEDVLYKAKNDESVRGLYEIEAVTADMILCPNGTILNKVKRATLYDHCHGIVELYNSTLTAEEKEIVAQKLQDALGNQIIATQSMQTALSYDGQLIVGSIGGMSFSKRLEAQNGMQKAELAVMSSCFLVRADIADVRAIFEKKSGTEELVETLKTFKAVCDRICSKTANTDHDQLMDMSDLLKVASEGLSEMYDIIWEMYFE